MYVCYVLCMIGECAGELWFPYSPQHPLRRESTGEVCLVCKICDHDTAGIWKLVADALHIYILCVRCRVLWGWLLRWLQNHKISSSYADQSGFEHMYHSQLTDKEKKKIAIIRPDALNSEAPAMGRQAAHNQVLHLAAEGMGMRRNSFATGAAEVFTAVLMMTLSCCFIVQLNALCGYTHACIVVNIPTCRSSMFHIT